MSLKLEAIPDSRWPPSPKRTHPKWLWGGLRAGSREDVGSGRGEKVGAMKLLRLRLSVALEGAHHFLCPPNPESGRPVCSHFGGAQRARRGAARRGWSAGVSWLISQPARRRSGGCSGIQPCLFPGPRSRGGGGREGEEEEPRGSPRPAEATRRQTPLNARTPLPSPLAHLARPASHPPRTTSEPQPAPAPRLQPAVITLPRFSLRWLILGRGEISLFPAAAPTPPVPSAPSLP